jgi:hypothetical protein
MASPPDQPPLAQVPSSPSAAEARPLSLIAIAGTAVFVGAIIGASTNTINGAVSPAYFINILGWSEVSDVWRASVAQGVFEGLIFGMISAMIFTLTIGIVTRATCPYTVAFRYLLAIMLGAYGCWVLGGLIAIGLALLSPEFYHHAFIGVPWETAEMLRYAWVGGSIWGVEFGGILSLIIGLVTFRGRWKRRAG